MEHLLRKELTNLICVSGANITHMEHLTSQKYVLKTKMREALKKQMEYLQAIDEVKNKLLSLNCA